jgi:hypothetical protein
VRARARERELRLDRHHALGGHGQARSFGRRERRHRKNRERGSGIPHELHEIAQIRAAAIDLHPSRFTAGLTIGVTGATFVAFDARAMITEIFELHGFVEYAREKDGTRDSGTALRLAAGVTF